MKQTKKELEEKLRKLEYRERALCDTIIGIGRTANFTSKGERVEDEWAYIPTGLHHINRMQKLLDIIKLNTSFINFIDIGAGTGAFAHIIRLNNPFIINIIGIERDPIYFNDLKTKTLSFIPMLHMDAFDLTKNHICSKTGIVPNVFYMYNPMKSMDLMHKLLRHVATLMSEKDYLIFQSTYDQNINPVDCFKMIGGEAFFTLLKLA